MAAAESAWLREVDRVQVRMHGREVGTLAAAADGRIAFEYASEWVDSGFSLSPLSLPLRSGVFLPRSYQPFGGLFGIFDDSLPDGWGRLLVDRVIRAAGRDPATVGAMERLRIVGTSGSGALTYHPGIETAPAAGLPSLDEVAAQVASVLDGHVSGSTGQTEDGGGELDVLFRLGGSSGGARPKVTYVIDGEPWIVKFPSRLDPVDIGVQERDYMRCAAACGIPVAPFRLMPSTVGPGFFATKRFDRIVLEVGGEGALSPSGPGWRDDGPAAPARYDRAAAAGNVSVRRVHMASAAALLETSHRVPNLDYITLVRLTIRLGCPTEDLETLVRLCAFNVYAHNRDDHSRNFSFLYDEAAQSWRLAPAYDLTYSSSIGGEHATTVAGDGRDPGLEEIVAVGVEAGLSSKRTRDAVEQVRDRVRADLGKYL